MNFSSINFDKLLKIVYFPASWSMTYIIKMHCSWCIALLEYTFQKKKLKKSYTFIEKHVFIYLSLLLLLLLLFFVHVWVNFEIFIWLIHIIIIIIIIHCCCRTIITVFINYVEVMEDKILLLFKWGKMNNNRNVWNIYIW